MGDESHDAATVDGEPPDPMHPGAQPGTDAADDAEDSEEIGDREPEPASDRSGGEGSAEGGAGRYEGSPGAALARDGEGDVPEPNEPA